MNRRHLYATIAVLFMIVGAYLSVGVAGSWAKENMYLYEGPLDYALDYLSDKPYKNLEIEVDWVMGYPPSHSAMSFLVGKIREYCEKDRVYVNWNYSSEIQPHRASYTLQDLVSLENEYRGLYKHGDTAVLYYLYLNGKFEDTGGEPVTVTETAGLEYGHSSIFIFKQQIINSAGYSVPAEYVERSVVLHEFGHAICLVGIGYKSAQEDPEHPHHSIYKNGVMYYAINTTSGQIPPQDFCNASKEDINFIKSHQRPISPVVYIPWMLLLADILAGGLLLAYVIKPKKNAAEVPEYDSYSDYSGYIPEDAGDDEDDIYF